MKWPIRVELRKSSGVWVGLSILIPAISIALLLIFFRDQSGNVVFISNFVLGIVASSALPLAIWRGIVAEEQVDTAQQGLRNERYQKGVEMLGNEVLTVRMGGIYALQRLAREHPGEYHVQAMQSLSAFVRRPTPDEKYEAELRANLNAKLQYNINMDAPVAREDVQDAMLAIGARGEDDVELEKNQKFQLDLSHARLNHMNLRDRSLSRRTNLSGTNLYDANLIGTFLLSVDLTGAWFGGADLSGARLQGAILSGATLLQAIVSDTKFGGVKGLTQSQLDQARRTEPSEKPPDLHNAFDAHTGKQLEWRG